jgi:quinol monooxygenase YgiN
MNGIIVIVAYRPKPGRETELLEIVRSRVPTLRKEGLVTDRVPVIMRAKDGTIIEVSEWKSDEAIEKAHQNPRVLAMWDKFGAVCDCIPLNLVPESATMFAGFEPIPSPPAEGMPTTQPLR